MYHSPGFWEEKEAVEDLEEEVEEGAVKDEKLPDQIDFVNFMAFENCSLTDNSMCSDI